MSTTSTRRLVFPLVGAHFRPPAKMLLACLPAGARLVLVPEPENPYDENACKAMVSPWAVPGELHEGLEQSLEGTGVEMEDLFRAGGSAEDTDPEQLVHLGYVQKTGGKPQLKNGFPGNADLHELVAAQGWEWSEVPCKLGWEGEQPCVVIELSTVQA